MDKILTTQKAIKVSQNLRKQGKKVVLVGGCFDILHIGHIAFLTKAKHLGDVLFVLLESDKAIRKLKGPKRPINSQINRAAVLAALEAVDYTVQLPGILSHNKYDDLVFKLKPAIIVTTIGDAGIAHKERQTKSLGITLFEVEKIANASTSRIARMLEEPY